MDSQIKLSENTLYAPRSGKIYTSESIQIGAIVPGLTKQEAIAAWAKQPRVSISMQEAISAIRPLEGWEWVKESELGFILRHIKTGVFLRLRLEGIGSNGIRPVLSDIVQRSVSPEVQHMVSEVLEEQERLLRLSLIRYGLHLRRYLDDFVEGSGLRHKIKLIYSDQIIICSVSFAQLSDSLDIIVEKLDEDVSLVLKNIIEDEVELRFLFEDSRICISKSARPTCWTKEEARRDSDHIIDEILCSRIKKIETQDQTPGRSPSTRPPEH